MDTASADGSKDGSTAPAAAISPSRGVQVRNTRSPSTAARNSIRVPGRPVRAVMRPNQQPNAVYSSSSVPFRVKTEEINAQFAQWHSEEWKHDGARLPAGCSPIKLLIAVTMYNEQADELNSTLTGIAQNIFHFHAAYKEFKLLEEKLSQKLADSQAAAARAAAPAPVPVPATATATLTLDVLTVNVEAVENAAPAAVPEETPSSHATADVEAVSGEATPMESAEGTAPAPAPALAPAPAAAPEAPTVDTLGVNVEAVAMEVASAEATAMTAADSSVAPATAPTPAPTLAPAPTPGRAQSNTTIQRIEQELEELCLKYRYAFRPEEIGVIVVVDGRREMNKDTLDWMEHNHLASSAVMEREVNVREQRGQLMRQLLDIRAARGKAQASNGDTGAGSEDGETELATTDSQAAAAAAEDKATSPASRVTEEGKDELIPPTDAEAEAEEHEDALLFQSKWRPPTMHSFVRSWQCLTGKDNGTYGAVYPPMQLIIAIKENNGQKLDSHKWFFDAYAAEMMPLYVVLVDVGTRPEPQAIVNMIKPMVHNPHVAGVCGEIMSCKGWSDMFSWFGNPVASAQLFEYKMAHCLDKPTESWLGYISVLPGAFSGYRYSALIGDHHPHLPSEAWPLSRYLKTVKDPHTGLEQHLSSPFEANMYLAEDRILCFEILATQDRKFVMEYVKNAVARTDVPMTLTGSAGLLRQRRRWLNGSFFAMIYSLLNFRRVISDTNHNVFRKLLLLVQYVFFCTNTVFTWFLPALFYLGYHLIVVTVYAQRWEAAAFVLVQGYVITTVTILLVSIDNHPEVVAGTLQWCAASYAIQMAVTTLGALYFAFQDAANPVVVAAAVGLFLIFIFAACLHGDAGLIIATIVHYWLLATTFMMMFSIYAFSNLDDVSWGNRPVAAYSSKMNETAEEKKKADVRAKAWRIRLKSFRTKFLAVYAVSNWLVIAISSAYFIKEGRTLFSTTMSAILLANLAFRVVGSVLYQTTRLMHYMRCCRSRERRLQREAADWEKREMALKVPSVQV